MSVTAAIAQELKPFQQKALEIMMTDIDPASRAVAEAQFKPMLANMSEGQVQMILEGYQASRERAAADEIAAADEPPADSVASPEDLEFNRAQYEPMVRNVWKAQKSFDDLVDNTVEQSCGKQGEFAVFGSGWRYELYPLNPTWTRASNSADLDVQIIGSSYAQSDARYQYDFSNVRTSYDQQAVIAAVRSACDEYSKIGRAFVSEARSKIANDDLPGGFEMENAANGKVSPVREKLNAELEALSPGGGSPLILALLNGEVVR
ncbi:MAG TPA: hypothetical protein VFG52_05410 [Xanthomonadales bacterium]|nr:hypothetical protein [Xanthomonadales bacterium]